MKFTVAASSILPRHALEDIVPRVAMTPIRSVLRKSRTLVELRQIYWRTRFGLLRRSAAWKNGAPDGLPIPNERLRFLISDTHNYPVDQFLEMGRLCHRRIQDSLRAHGVELDDLGALLDFGCGCGRTLRQFATLKRTQLYGTDYNPELIGWCRPNLGFARFGLNRLEPPMSYADQMFGLVYAFSVFTHLPEPLQHSWMKELTRILKPGGYLVLSTMPPKMLPDAEARTRFAAGKLVVLKPEDAGANSCIVFHPTAYMKETLAAGYDVLEFIPDGVGQDFWLLRKQPPAPADRG